jgi:hypothetical protein
MPRIWGNISTHVLGIIFFLSLHLTRIGLSYHLIIISNDVNILPLNNNNYFVGFLRFVHINLSTTFC